MIEDLQLRVLPQVAVNGDELTRVAARERGVSPNRIKSLKILKRSVDARQRTVMVNIKVRIGIDEIADATSATVVTYRELADNAPVAIVVGMGPAGLFAALRLIEMGVRPIIVERGKNVKDRRVDVARISREGIVDPDSNYCFGEGGAGAYSDGKLYTRSKKRGSVEHILQVFYSHGADENILIDAHPHIGSDRLPVVIEAMRNTILRCGGEVHFNTHVSCLLLNTTGDEVRGVATRDGKEFLGPVILATGHSARDVYRMLNKVDISLQAKGIAVGVRLEHPQHLIDQIQYHNPAGRGEWLPAAEYAFVTQVEGRGVYSFCMCPGGVIVPATSEPGLLVVNGMSPAKRNTHWANSGMVVELHPEDLPAKYDATRDVLAMINFQNDLETECFKQAGNSQVAGAQRMKDFVDRAESRLIPPSSYPAGVQPSRIDRWLPKGIATRLRRGFTTFGKQAKGFLTNQAIVIGVETRTSSPVRIPRDTISLHHISIKGLYPCGEGAGYAGGIVSSAIDGERCAEAVAHLLLHI